LFLQNLFRKNNLDDDGTINNFIRPILSNHTSTRTSDIDDVSKLIMMPMVTLTSTTTTLTSSISSTSMIGLITEHDRPFSDYGHLSMIMIMHDFSDDKLNTLSIIICNLRS